ncbi:MAG TPA: ABC transporter ATP-binding protein [Anaerolineales bacterium]|nr:ABC transporter ATP-binding protein [Anaerolineales bacterium]
MPEATLPALRSIELRGIVKRFPGVVANDHVSLTVQAGEIHALLGENGAGKTTLMRILYGLYQPDEGEILLDGRPVRVHSPADSIRHGIGMIHQHFMLVPTLTVAENVALGLPSSRGLLLDTDRVSRRIEELAVSYGLQVDPKAVIWQLSVGEQQRVEILKALYRGAQVLILDEPTAVLTPQEVQELFVTLRRMAAEGHLLIFISHKLHEVLAISDRVTVLRGGRVVQGLKTAETNRQELARLMVGREVLLRVERPTVALGQPRLLLDDVWADGDRGLPAVRGVSLEVRAGEILGVAGVSGNGQRELAEMIAGLRHATRGRVLLDGVEITAWEPGARLARGLSYIPEERMRDGVIRELSVEENIIIESHGRPPLARGVFLDFGRIGQHVDRLVDEFEIKTPSRSTPLRNLSGGNIQKLILARELAKEPSVLVAAQPTRGVDIGSTEYIHRRLVEQRARGTATLLISEDLDEVRNLSDRLAVLYEGRLMGILDREQATVERLGLMMAGVPLDEALSPRA